MADKAISELVAAEQIKAADMFVLEQDGSAKSLTGQILLNWLTKAADGHGGVQSITKTDSSSLVDTYTITLADQTKQTFTVTNGATGDKGDNAYVWIKYASQQPTASSHSMSDIPDKWIGIYSGTSATAPSDWQQYKWFQYKGDKGDTGSPASLVSSKIEYQASDSGTVIPSGTWATTVPAVAGGKYLWTRVTMVFNSGDPVVTYSVGRFGLDGSGAVSSVAGIAPNSDGNVPLTAADINALALSGGTMRGTIDMNGQAITGLNNPTEDSQAANKAYADTKLPKTGGQITGDVDVIGHVALSRDYSNGYAVAYKSNGASHDYGTTIRDVADGSEYTEIILNAANGTAKFTVDSGETYNGIMPGTYDTTAKNWKVTVDGVTYWHNPAMVAGTEYLTTERWKGKPVYAKMIDLGTLPATATTKAVTHGISNGDLFGFVVVAKKGTTLQQFPFFNSSGSAEAKAHLNDTSVVITTFTANLGEYSAIALLKYTKG